MPSRSRRAATTPRRASITKTVPSTSPSANRDTSPSETAADAVTGNGVVQSHAGVEYAADAAAAAEVAAAEVALASSSAGDGSGSGSGSAASSSAVASVFASRSPRSAGTVSCLCAATESASSAPRTENIAARLHPGHAAMSASARPAASRRKYASGAPALFSSGGDESVFVFVAASPASEPSSFSCSSASAALGSASVASVASAPSSSPAETSGEAREAWPGARTGAAPNAAAARAASSHTRGVAAANAPSSCVCAGGSRRLSEPEPEPNAFFESWVSSLSTSSGTTL